MKRRSLGSEEKGTERGSGGSWPTPMEIFAWAPRILLVLGQRNANDRLSNTTPSVGPMSSRPFANATPT